MLCIAFFTGYCTVSSCCIVMGDFSPESYLFKLASSLFSSSSVAVLSEISRDGACSMSAS